MASDTRHPHEDAKPPTGGQDTAKPGTKLPNPAEPYATVEVPERKGAESFVKAAGGDKAKPPTLYPRTWYHPVHGGIEVKTFEEEAALQPKHDWFETPELADAARTWTEAETVRMMNMKEKLKTLEDAGHPVVRNSVQADESIRRGGVEPL